MNLKNCYFLIAAREGSKGFPYKNRKLFNYTAEIIPKMFCSKVYVSTDDDIIKSKAKTHDFNVVDRPKELAQDSSSLKPVIKHFIDAYNIDENSTIVLLFLTYPERTWDDVKKILNVFHEKKCNSLICADEVSEHPYLCFYELENGRGKLVVDHSLYRRQDYPKCFKQSMYLGCYKAKIVEKLHDLLFEEDTFFYKLDASKIDVDYEEDYNDAKSR